MEAHIPRHRNSKTKKPRHRDFKTKKPRHPDLGTKTPRHREMETIKSDIVIPRRFFRGLKATTSRFQDQKATTSSSRGILTLMSPDSDTSFGVICLTEYGI